jgi:hypothetical protein
LGHDTKFPIHREQRELSGTQQKHYVMYTFMIG